MTEETIHCKLVAKRDGMYTVFVFEISYDKYIMCTKLPNWGPINIKIGDSRFLTYQAVESGDSYYDRDTGEQKTFKFSNIYFKDFVKDIETDKIIL